MARNTTPAPESKAVPANNVVIAAEMTAANQMAVIERSRQDIQTQAEQEKDEVLAAGIDIGRLEAMDFVLTVSTAAILATYENVKKSKAWRHLRNPRSAHGEHFLSLEEFCEVKLGKSYQRLRAITANRNVIGSDAFEQAERLGLRQVDYNAIKGLPAPDQELVRRAVEEAQSRDEVLDLLQELAGRHAHEKDAFARQTEEAKQEHAATTKRLEVVTKQKEAAEAKAARIAVMKPDESLADLHQELAVHANEALGMVQGRVRMAFEALTAHHADHGSDSLQVMAGYVGQLQQLLNELRDDFNLPDTAGNGTPEWKRWADAQDAAAEPAAAGH